MIKILCSILLLFASLPAIAGDLPGFPFVSVSGVAEVDIPPDEATISLVIMEFNEDSETAMAVVVKRGAEIISSAREFNISMDDISSFSVDKSVVRARNMEYQSMEILGYEISQEFNIKIKDISVYSDFSDRIVAMQNVSNVSASFDLSRRDEILRRLVKEASQDARRRAENLANGLGVKVASVFSISEDFDAGIPSARFNADEKRVMMFAASAEQGADTFNLFVPKTINLSKTVNVIFKIEPGA